MNEQNVVLSIICLGLLVSCAIGHKKERPDYSNKSVNIPDSIFLMLEKAYMPDAIGHPIGVNAGRNVYNLGSSNDTLFQDGLFTFKGQGPHFPRRIFIFHQNKLFVFKSIGAFDPQRVITEYAAMLDSFPLTNEQAIQYLLFIGTYLQEESKEAYGTEIQKD